MKIPGRRADLTHPPLRRPLLVESLLRSIQASLRSDSWTVNFQVAEESRWRTSTSSSASPGLGIARGRWSATRDSTSPTTLPLLDNFVTRRGKGSDSLAGRRRAVSEEPQPAPATAVEHEHHDQRARRQVRARDARAFRLPLSGLDQSRVLVASGHRDLHRHGGEEQEVLSAGGLVVYYRSHSPRHRLSTRSVFAEQFSDCPRPPRPVAAPRPARAASVSEEDALARRPSQHPGLGMSATSPRAQCQAERAAEPLQLNKSEGP